MGTERIGGRYSRPELSSHLRKQTHIFPYIPIARGIWKISVPSQDFCEYQTALKVTESCSVVSDSLQPHGLQPARLLCPCRFSRQEYWSGQCSLLQGIFPIQGTNPHPLHWQVDSSPLSHQGSPLKHSYISLVAIIWNSAVLELHHTAALDKDRTAWKYSWVSQGFPSQRHNSNYCRQGRGRAGILLSLKDCYQKSMSPFLLPHASFVHKLKLHLLEASELQQHAQFKESSSPSV